MKSFGSSLAISLLLFVVSSAHSATPISSENWAVCENGACTRYSTDDPIKNIRSDQKGAYRTVEIKTQISSTQLSLGHCLYIGEVGDTVKVTLNGHNILDLNDGSLTPTFYRYLSTFTYIPPEFVVAAKNELVFHVTDLNQSIFGLRSKLTIGSFSEVLGFATKDFLMRTGSSLLSAFTLCFFTASALIAFYFLRIRQLLFLSIYGAVSIFYLLSFSEIPRSFFDPILLSGPIHFSLRLIQDLGLCLLLVSTFRFTRQSRLSTALITAYLGACGILWATYFANRDYVSVQRAMFYFAPLVAFPTVLGFLLSLDFPDISEGIWNRRVFGILIALQVNDLLVFWQVYEGYFFVKWYIPLLFIYIFFILTRRASQESRERALKIRLGAEFRQFAHDIRSPLTSLKIGLSEIRARERDSEHVSLMAAAMERIAEVSMSVLNSSKESRQKCAIPVVIHSLRETCELFKRTTQTSIQLENNIGAQRLEIGIDKSTFLRVVENLLRNSTQAMKDAGEVRITTNIVSNNFTLEINDSGPGFPPEVLTGVGLEGLSRTKDGGFGYGLNYCVQIIESAKGRLKIHNKKSGGAAVQIILPTKQTQSPSLGPVNG